MKEMCRYTLLLLMLSLKGYFQDPGLSVCDLRNGFEFWQGNYQVFWLRLVLWGTTRFLWSVYSVWRKELKRNLPSSHPSEFYQHYNASFKSISLDNSGWFEKLSGWYKLKGIVYMNRVSQGYSVLWEVQTITVSSRASRSEETQAEESTAGASLAAFLSNPQFCHQHESPPSIRKSAWTHHTRGRWLSPADFYRKDRRWNGLSSLSGSYILQFFSEAWEKTVVAWYLISFSTTGVSSTFRTPSFPQNLILSWKLPGVLLLTL